MSVCNLCPRRCGADREKGEIGFCKMGYLPVVSKAYLHMWEEPPVSGEQGSGTVFFNGCHLRCIFCQNSEISRGGYGKEVGLEYLADIFLRLMKKGAHNINLVTPTHFAQHIAEAVSIARSKGLNLPVVYNTGGYELTETLRLMENSVDVYLPDFKYMFCDAARKYSFAEDYPQVAKKALEEMVRQKPKAIFSDEGLIKEGVIVRHLLLPGNLKNSKAVVEYLYKTYGDSICISIMNQYTPIGEFPNYPELSQTPSRREYEKLVDFALSLGISNAYVQDLSSSDTAYIPYFDMEGI